MLLRTLIVIPTVRITTRLWQKLIESVRLTDTETYLLTTTSAAESITQEQLFERPKVVCGG
jgi:hypothetical protein